ncbi:MAG: inositol-1-monophosphatase [Gammaproteobacteria bacterium]|nr:inositol-1-monophosphatase [Gammaproteobacteria bacterium]
MHPMLNIATRAARAAGNLIVRAIQNPEDVKSVAKGRNDYVSEIDERAESIIIDTLRKTFPGHAITTEESAGVSNPDAEYEWIIDPLDGTTNFLHGLPHVSISMALKYKGKLEAGLIYDPLRDELFTATRGGGAQMNGKRIRVAGAKDLNGTLLATGFPFKKPQHFEPYMAMFKALFPHCGDMRRAGSAALDLAYVAAGRVDGFWELGLMEWDIAAGVLMVQEAGGLVGDFGGGHKYLESGNVIAANPKVFKAMLQTLGPAIPPELRQLWA